METILKQEEMGRQISWMSILPTIFYVYCLIKLDISKQLMCSILTSFQLHNHYLKLHDVYFFERLCKLFFMY